MRSQRSALIARLLADPGYERLSAFKREVRKSRTIGRMMRILGRFFDTESHIELKPIMDDDEKFVAIVEDHIEELTALDRYERRSISKRKSAIRAFDSACRFGSDSNE